MCFGGKPDVEVPAPPQPPPPQFRLPEIELGDEESRKNNERNRRNPFRFGTQRLQIPLGAWDTNSSGLRIPSRRGGGGS